MVVDASKDLLRVKEDAAIVAGGVILKKRQHQKQEPGLLTRSRRSEITNSEFKRMKAGDHCSRKLIVPIVLKFIAGFSSLSASTAS